MTSRWAHWQADELTERATLQNKKVIYSKAFDIELLT